MVGNVIPLMGNLCDQLTEQLNKVVGQVKHLPRYQVGLVGLAGDACGGPDQGVPEVASHHGQVHAAGVQREHKRIVRDLAEHIDRRLTPAASMGG